MQATSTTCVLVPNHSSEAPPLKFLDLVDDNDDADDDDCATRVVAVV